MLCLQESIHSLPAVYVLDLKTLAREGRDLIDTYSEPEEAEELRKTFVLQTAPFDSRFPNTNVSMTC